ncbi:hypothetical protein SAMN05421760_103165 [Neptunomonas antarctica]|uniref:Uncharacterized protein n=1 Tax=Neptunomonas antarctica TaxID=619304 RepID=A0A1N7L230_9GAMM|nr:hypothetical protein SAMN05421760_103165 [Neptunomonas antarctica]
MANLIERLKRYSAFKQVKLGALLVERPRVLK